MSRRLGLWVGLLWLGWPAFLSAATVRIGLVVGHNLGLPEEAPLSFAERDAERFAELMLELGGFEPERMLRLLGPTRAELEAQLTRVLGQVVEIHARGDKAFLLFYFSGHGSEQGLHLGLGRFAHAELKAALKATQAEIIIGILDACGSGGIARQKGGVPDKAFDISLVEDLSPEGLIFLTSSQGDEPSQESWAAGGSLFTQALISALRGAADFDNDGRVSLREAYLSAYHRTLTHSLTTSDQRQHPIAHLELSGKGELSLTNLRKSSARIRLGADQQGRYVVVKEPGGRVMAEIFKESGREVAIALPAGEYGVLKQERDEVRVGRVSLVWGGSVLLDESGMKGQPYERVAQKGQGLDRAFLRLGFGGEWVDGVLPGMSSNAAGGISVWWILESRWSLGLQFSYTQRRFEFDPPFTTTSERPGGFDPLPLQIQQRELRVGVGLGHEFAGLVGSLAWLSLEPRLWIEYLHGFQDQQAEGSLEPPLSYAGSVRVVGLGPELALRMRLSRPLSLVLKGRGELAWSWFDYHKLEQPRGSTLVSTPGAENQSLWIWTAGLGLDWDF